MECLRFKDLNTGAQSTDGGGQGTTFLTAADDRLVKIWDARTGKKEAHLQYGNLPFYSVDTNGQVIAAGADRDVIFWDIRKMKVPLEVLESSHSEDVTSVRFHPDPAFHQRVLTCSTDCLVNFFDFAGKETMKEDDVLEVVYRSEQPLMDCGFTCSTLGGEKFYALTSVNTLEICFLE